MGLAKIFTLISLSMSVVSCTPSRSSDSQDFSSKYVDYYSAVEKNCNWEKITKKKQYNGFFLSSKGEIYGLTIDSDDSFPIDSYVQLLPPMPYADAETLEICINDDNEPYAKDNTRVYYGYNNDALFEDGENMYAEFHEGDLSIYGADPTTFKYLGKGYAVDKNNMYYSGKKIKWNDHIITALQQDECPEILPVDYGMANNEK